MLLFYYLVFHELLISFTPRCRNRSRETYKMTGKNRNRDAFTIKIEYPVIDVAFLSLSINKVIGYLKYQYVKFSKRQGFNRFVTNSWKYVLLRIVFIYHSSAVYFFYNNNNNKNGRKRNRIY